MPDVSSLSLPPTKSTTSFWQENPHALADHRSTEHLPIECDVLIIGSGYAGVATAYHLVRSGYQGSIVLLEARQACSGATGRNGGHLRPDLYMEIPGFVRRYGLEAGRAWAEFERSHISAIAEVVEAEGIDCDLLLTKSTACYINAETAKKAKANYDLLTSLDLPHMSDVQFRVGTEAATFSGVKEAKACLTFSAASLWPYKFVLACLERILESGRVNLQTTTPATAIHVAPAGGYVVNTTRGSINATKVVHATNAYVSTLLPEYAKSIVACKGRCAQVAVPEGGLARRLHNTYVVRDEANVMSYLIPRHDGDIIVGGSSRLYAPYRDQWYKNIDDGTLIDAASDYYEDYMQRHFAGWENSKAYVKRAWVGVMGYSWDTLPHLGEVPLKPSQYILAGFNGHGMPVIWLAAKGIAEMVATGKPYEDVALPIIGKTTLERIRTAQAGPEGGDILN